MVGGFTHPVGARAVPARSASHRPQSLEPRKHCPAHTAAPGGRARATHTPALTFPGFGIEITRMTTPARASALNRRRFLCTSTAAASGLMLTWTTGWAAPASRPRPRKVSPNEKLNIAAIGAGGQAATDISG